MSDQLELREQQQIEYPSVEKTQTLAPSTSNPSGKPSERTSTKEKSSKPVKHKIFPFTWPEIIDSKFMALLTKQDLVLTKIIKVIEEDQKRTSHNWKTIINRISTICTSMEDPFTLTID